MFRKVGIKEIVPIEEVHQQVDQRDEIVSPRGIIETQLPIAGEGNVAPEGARSSLSYMVFITV